jgi:lipopolysaccharide transport system ATP-binding protein
VNSIEIDGVGKAYKTYPRKWGRAAEWLGFPPQHQPHWVLRDVNLRIAPGETVGLIGMNGAGKSTLLKIIAGVTRPTTGAVRRTGRLAALLELAMGFHPDFPGRQNVYMAGQLQGLSAEEVRRHMPEIEAFAEIGDYIDEPVRTYSSGMQVRLAFSVATAVRPDILIVDEALAVGDIYFQQKCYERLAKFREQGTTLLLVSHSLATIVQLCDRAVLLRKGDVAFDGAPKEATDLYQADVLLSLDKRQDEMAVAGEQRAAGGSVGSVSSASVTFLEAATYDERAVATQTLVENSPVEVRVRYAIDRDLDDPHVGFKIRNRYGVVLFETNSYCMRARIGPRRKGDTLSVSFRFPLLLAPGDYTLTVGFANRGFGAGSFEEALSFQHDIHAFTVVRPADCVQWSGAVNLRPELSVTDPR